MTWEQLVKGQAKDYKFFLTGYKQSLDQLNADKELLLGQHTEATAPENVRDKINRDFIAWQDIWGIDGQKIQAMRTIHHKELDAFFGANE
jgi:hypothetical protein